MTHKLLLADDSVTIQRVVELTFSGEDIQVVTVGDGEQAIARIPLEHPDIVLADIGMPKRSGYEVAAFVKGRPDLSHIPVILLAGAFEPVDEARAQQVKSDGVLVKPFEPQQVIARVRELIDAAAQLKTAPRTEPAVPAVAAVEPRFTSPSPPTASPSPVAASPSPLAASSSHAAAPEPRRPEPKGLGAEVKAHVGDVRRHAPEPAMPSEDYFDFDRLDAAFARLGSDHDTPEPPPRQRDDYSAGFDVPTVDNLLASAKLRDLPGPSVTRVPKHEPTGSTTNSPAGNSSFAGDNAAGRNVIADVFSALFAVEQGDPDAAPLRLAPPSPPPPAITDELVEEITRRVLQRLAPNAARDVVAQIVSEVAERLIREEISRIKSAAAKRA